MGLGALLIRADASPEIGAGHVMRCLALAQAWQDGGGKAVFATSQVIPAIESKILAENCEVIHVSGEIGSQADCKYTQELGRHYSAEWIVLDGYCFDSNYRKSMKEAGFKLLVIDDLGVSGDYSDIILNQNLHAKQSMYPDRNRDTVCLLGPRFALLRREFAKAEFEGRHARGMATRVLVMMGGTDPHNVSKEVVQAVAALSINSLRVKVVVGPGNRHTDALRRLCSTKSEIQVIVNPSSVAELMKWADLAISAAGSTIWELCWFGVPSVLVSTADNQAGGAEELSRRGLAIYPGRYQDISWPTLAQVVRDLLLSAERRESMSEAASALVDGQGAERAVNALRSHGMKLRRVTRDDSMLLWNWVNDPQVRAASFHSEPISEAEHSRWFEAKLNNPNTAIYVAEDGGGTALGHLRFEWSREDDAEISISIAAGKRGSGIACTLIRKATEMAARDVGLRQFHAYIKPENRASIRAFEKAGFSGFETVAKGIHCCMTTDPRND